MQYIFETDILFISELLRNSPNLMRFLKVCGPSWLKFCNCRLTCLVLCLMLMISFPIIQIFCSHKKKCTFPNCVSLSFIKFYCTSAHLAIKQRCATVTRIASTLITRVLSSEPHSVRSASIVLNFCNGFEFQDYQFITPVVAHDKWTSVACCVT